MNKMIKNSFGKLYCIILGYKWQTAERVTTKTLQD